MLRQSEGRRALEWLLSSAQSSSTSNDSTSDDRRSDSVTTPVGVCSSETWKFSMFMSVARRNPLTTVFSWSENLAGLSHAMNSDRRNLSRRNDLLLCSSSSPPERELLSVLEFWNWSTSMFSYAAAPRPQLSFPGNECSWPRGIPGHHRGFSRWRISMVQVNLQAKWRNCQLPGLRLLCEVHLTSQTWARNLSSRLQGPR